jgi:glutamyl-tRNA reductase
MVATAVLDRPSRPLTLVDVSLPRNVDVAVRSVSGAQLIGIDDLGPYIAAAHTNRRAMIPAVEWIVEEELALMRVRLARRATGATRATPTMTVAVSA